jgi:hypothetical protein
MLNCKQLTQQASDYLDGGQTFSARIQIRLHVFICVHCRRFLNHLKISQIVLRNKKAIPADIETVERVMETLPFQQDDQP